MLEMFYLAVLLIVICIMFVPLKRPIYEAMLVAYIVMVVVTGQWGGIFKYALSASTPIRCFMR